MASWAAAKGKAKAKTLVAVVVLMQWCIVMIAARHPTAATQGEGGDAGWLRRIVVDHLKGGSRGPGYGNRRGWQAGAHP